MLYAKPANKLASKEKAICRWVISKLDTEEVVGTGSFTAKLLPNRRQCIAKMSTDVIENPAKYAVELELKGQNDEEFEKRRIFVLSVIDRVEFQVQTLASIAATMAIIFATISLIISIVAICKG